MLPAGCKRVEWIASTGTQYVKTGVVPNQDTRVYAECVFATASSTQGLFGARVSSSSRQFQFVTSGGYYRTDYNTTAANMTNASFNTSKFYIDKNKNITNLNGSYTHTHTYAAFTCPGEMLVFATNNNGTPYALSAARLDVMKIWSNGTLVRDYIPYVDETGDANLWDEVANAPAEKVGTFNYGPALIPSTPANLRRTNDGRDSVELAWDASDNANRYIIKRNGANIADVYGNVLYYVDSTIKMGNSYTYEVIAYNGSQVGGSSIVTVEIEKPLPPSAPEAVRTALSVLLRWNASTGADSYNIYRDGVLIGTTTAAQYVDTTAEENETYTYAVSAVGIGGESARTEITVYTRTGYFQYKPYIQSANFQ